MSMTNEATHTDNLLTIAEVERQTGIRPATLRMWEKRYGFPQPLRDRHGDRVYPVSQVERLQAVRCLMDQGFRPGKILAGGLKAGIDPPRPDAANVPAAHRHVFALLRAYGLAELHGHFQYRLLELGLRRFVIEFLAPLSKAVGTAWSRGELPIRCEHLYAQLAMSILHAKQAAVRTAGDGRPRVVLATLTGETHALGIMMVEAVLATLGAECVQLGSNTPPLEVAAAARESGADIVALSFSASFPARSLVRMTAALRAGLPPAIAVWAGGDGIRDQAALASGIDVIDTLDAIEPALVRWHARAGRQGSIFPLHEP